MQRPPRRTCGPQAALSCYVVSHTCAHRVYSLDHRVSLVNSKQPALAGVCGTQASGDAEASGEFGAVAREAVASRAGGAAGGARVSWAPAPPKVRLLACAACCLLLHLRAGGLGSNLGLGLVEPSGGSGPGRVLTARRALLGGGEAGEALAPLRWLGGEHPEWARCAPCALDAVAAESTLHAAESTLHLVESGIFIVFHLRLAHPGVSVSTPYRIALAFRLPYNFQLTACSLCCSLWCPPA